MYYEYLVSVLERKRSHWIGVLNGLDGEVEKSLARQVITDLTDAIAEVKSAAQNEVVGSFVRSAMARA